MKFLCYGVSSSVAVIALLLTTAVTPATAAGAKLATKAPPPAPLYGAPSTDWSGFYLGINGGDGWGKDGGSRSSGGMAGGTIGYNVQTGPTVYGIEADLDWSGADGQKYLSTVRGRLGYASGQLLPYLTGGLAFDNASGIGNPGWTLGGGVEYRLSQVLSVKAEYLYVAFDHGDVRDNILRAGLNWQFGAAGLVAGR
jgi:outer membrane immunogenic protein